MFPIGPVVETTVFATYKRQQTMLERQRRLTVIYYVGNTIPSY